jgi:hypothetical protein
MACPFLASKFFSTVLRRALGELKKCGGDADILVSVGMDLPVVLITHGSSKCGTSIPVG